MEERVLLELLCRELTKEKQCFSDDYMKADWQRLLDLAERQGVLSLLYAPLSGLPGVPEEIRRQVQRAAKQTALQSYRLLFLSRYLLEALRGAGIAAVLLKGPAAAVYYPAPELRKSGDVDLLLLEPKRQKEAQAVLESCGCRILEQQKTLHHITCMLEGIGIELHTMLAEPFDNVRINQYLQERLRDCAGTAKEADLMGLKLPVLSPGYHAYELLLHMLQHYLRAGFGLKLLCDWVVFWNQGPPEREVQTYRRLIRESRLEGFSDAVTETCCVYLGLCREAVPWMRPSGEGTAKELMTDILDGGEFGRSSSGRMVSLRGQGTGAYIREFHHQMCLSFPAGSRCPLCWPVLWPVTLVRFLRNNRLIRGIPMRTVLRSAGQRSRLTAKMELWK